MATLTFSVGREGQDPIALTATLPALSKHDSAKAVPFSVRLPDGREIRGEIDAPSDLMLAQATIQLQHAVRDLVFPRPTSNGGGKRKRAAYAE